MHLRGKHQGWITGEYSMLPGATAERGQREATRGRQAGRTLEIQRLIGRSLRSCIDMTKLGMRTIFVDCDVLQADGGTRCASITGGFVALCDAIQTLIETGGIEQTPVLYHVASVSVGIVDEQVMLDIDFSEDSAAQTDMNFVMNESGHFIEVQGTAERSAFSKSQLLEMTTLAESGIMQLIAAQKAALAR